MAETTIIKPLDGYQNDVMSIQSGNTSLKELVANQANYSVRYYYINPSSVLTDYPITAYHLNIIIMKDVLTAQILVMQTLATNPMTINSRRFYCVASGDNWTLYQSENF